MMNSKPRQGRGNIEEEPDVRIFSEVEPRILGDLGWEKGWSPGQLQRLGTACTLGMLRKRRLEPKKQTEASVLLQKVRAEEVSNTVQRVEQWFSYWLKLPTQSPFFTWWFSQSPISARCSGFAWRLGEGAPCLLPPLWPLLGFFCVPTDPQRTVW